MEWQDKEFTALTVDELQRIYWLRAQVFNAEQQSSYPEPDEQDRHCHHLFAREGEQVVAYARYFATADGVSFGRVVVAKAYRGTGVGRALLQRLLARIKRHFPGQAITIHAQTPVVGYYQQAGFEVVGQPFMEAQREHVTMVHPGMEE